MDDGQNQVKEYFDQKFYDTNGEFKPVVASHGNVDGDIAELRNNYMNAEREYFVALLSQKRLRDRFTKLAYSTDYTPELLLEAAMRLQENLENDNLYTREEEEAMKSMTPGERDKVHMEKLSETEGLIALFLGAIKDKALVLDYLIPYRTELPSELEPVISRGMGH